MDLITVVVVAVVAWSTLAILVLALCRAAALADSSTERIYRSPAGLASSPRRHATGDASRSALARARRFGTG
jgi:hypothetical protein